MNKKWQKQKRVAASAAQAIECDGSQLCLVLAKLRRAGRTASEPEKVGPNRWRVYPGRSGGEFVPEPSGVDRVYGFRSFSQGMRGQLEY